MSLIAAGVISVAVAGGQAAQNHSNAQAADNRADQSNQLAAGYNENAKLASSMEKRRAKTAKQYEPALVLTASEAENKSVLQEQALPGLGTLATRESKRMAIDAGDSLGMDPGTARRGALDLAGGAATANQMAQGILDLDTALNLNDFQRKQQAIGAGKSYAGVM